MTTQYDIVIIGAGGGGITAAFEAYRQGAKVALLEKRKIGGECTHSGCVPSKALIDVGQPSRSKIIVDERFNDRNARRITNGRVDVDVSEVVTAELQKRLQARPGELAHSVRDERSLKVKRDGGYTLHWIDLASHNGRFLRHRPKRSERV